VLPSREPFRIEHILVTSLTGDAWRALLYDRFNSRKRAHCTLRSGGWVVLCDRLDRTRCMKETFLLTHRLGWRFGPVLRTACIRRHWSSRYIVWYTVWLSAADTEQVCWKATDRHCLHFRFCPTPLFVCLERVKQFRMADPTPRVWNAWRIEVWSHRRRYSSWDSGCFNLQSSMKTVTTIFLQTFLMHELPSTTCRSCRFNPLKFTASLSDLISLWVWNNYVAVGISLTESHFGCSEVSQI
jgi:hypothetical protein